MNCDLEEDDGQQCQVFDFNSLKNSLDLDLDDDALEFKEMIRTRKEELRKKTEEKRKEIVKKLEVNKMNSQVKLCGLPNEMWTEVLTQLKDPGDIGSMWEIHPKFQDLSDEFQRRECVLSQVLTILITRLWDLWFWNVDDFRTHYKLVSSYKTFRTLSKGIKKTVDHLLEENLIDSHRDREKTSHCYYYIAPITVGTVDGVISNFCEGPVESRAKNVFHRSIVIRFQWQPYWERVERWQYTYFRDKVTSLFEVIGEQMWYCSLEFTPLDFLEMCGVSITEVYLLIQHWVSLMPNLKRLTLYLEYQMEGQLDHYGDQPRTTIARETFEQHPFPHLKQLEQFKFGFYYGQEGVSQKYEILAEVLRSNPQIKILDFGKHSRLDVGRLFLATSHEMMELLSGMKLHTLYDGHYLPHSVNFITDPLVHMQWPLKSLYLRFHEEFMGRVFNCLGNFPTVQHLELYVTNLCLEEDEIPLLRLPLLTQFKFRFEFLVCSRTHEPIVNFSMCPSTTFSFFSLQFLIESKLLKSLSWANEDFRNTPWLRKLRRFMINREQHEKFINFRAGLRDLTYSNIWDVFPELEFTETSFNAWFRKRKYFCNKVRRPKLF